jgi:hypothetical protein
MLAGFCYTPLVHTFPGGRRLPYADRTPKIPLDAVARATRGTHGERERHVAEERRARMLPPLHGPG